MVSIITPSYNSAQYIFKSIESVLTQTLTNWELIIVDDCSTDNSVEIIQSFVDLDSRIKLIQLPVNSGAAVARNTAIDEAQGRFIAFLDSDDVWKPKKLENQIGFMQTKDIAFTYGDYLKVDKMTGEEVSSIVLPDELTYKDLLRSCPIGCLTAAYDKEKLGKVYMPNVRQGQDWGLWLALTRDGTKAYKYPGCEAYYYVGENSLSANKLQKGINMYRIYKFEENLSYISSIWFLFRHTLYVLNK